MKIFTFLGGVCVSISSQCCVCVYEETKPQDPSATTSHPVNCPSTSLSKGRLPGKVGTKFMATAGMAGGQQAFLGCLLGPWASQVEEAGVEDFQRE